MSLLFLTKKDNTSKARIKIQAKLGSPGRASLKMKLLGSITTTDRARFLFRD